MTTVVIDPGHGGTAMVGGSSPNNATGPAGLKEKVVTLKVGLATQKALAGSGITVLMTRNTDQNVGIVDRARVAKRADAAVFVSIHFNGPGENGPAAQGTETWIGQGHTRISAELAALVQKRVLAVTGYRDRGVKVGNVSGVIKPANHNPDTASCLCEISFLTRQPAEERRLGDQTYIDALGAAIADAITTHLRDRGLMPEAAAAAAGVEPEDAASAYRLGLFHVDEAPATASETFEPPPTVWAEPSGPRGATPEFEAPPAAVGIQSVGSDDDDQPAIGVPSADLVGMHRELQRAIFARAALASTQADGDAPPPPSQMLVGVGIGPASRDFESVGPAGPGAPVINLYVAEPMNMELAKAILVDSFGARALSSDRETVNVIHTGQIDAYGHRHRQRPSPCGISVGHTEITAGTQGALARGRSGARQNRLFMISNNHVLANSNDASPGDLIIQPGPADDKKDPANAVAALERWVAIDFSEGAKNYVDCACAWCWPDRVRSDFIYRRGDAWDYFKVTGAPVEPTVGLNVGKSGRTTQLTSGRILDVNASISVNFGRGRVANFVNQITIKGHNNVLFSRGGDSGSLIWTWEERRAPVGLLFAGGRDITFANRISLVLDALDLSLYS